MSALWWEFLGAAGLGAGEEDKAPIGRRLAFENHQSIDGLRKFSFVDAVFARFSISTDGRQILRTKATTVISKTVTATINPDGSAQNGLPDGRTDLFEIEALLKQPLEVENYPYRCWSPPE